MIPRSLESKTSLGSKPQLGAGKDLINNEERFQITYQVDCAWVLEFEKEDTYEDAIANIVETEAGAGNIDIGRNPRFIELKRIRDARDSGENLTDSARKDVEKLREIRRNGLENAFKRLVNK